MNTRLASMLESLSWTKRASMAASIFTCDTKATNLTELRRDSGEESGLLRGDPVAGGSVAHEAAVSERRLR